MKGWWKLAFGVLGLGSLSLILRDYGYGALARDLAHVGWRLLPLSLTFVPTLCCYTMVWYLVTDRTPGIHESWKKAAQLWGSMFRITVISIAWNNLSPFIKLLGEPIRLVELRKVLPDKRRSLRSVLLYNLTHTMGTILSFIIAALTIPLLFDVGHELRKLLWISVFGFVSVLSLFWLLPWLIQRGLKLAKIDGLRRASLWLRWSVHKIRRFYKNHKLALVSALIFSVSARFIEGLTFFYAFQIFGENLHFITAAYLDVGRTLADTAFFFVPYQLGSREYAVGFLLEHVFLIGGKTFIGGTLLYRLVEIIWMIIGYFWWGLRKKHS